MSTGKHRINNDKRILGLNARPRLLIAFIFCLLCLTSSVVAQKIGVNDTSRDEELRKQRLAKDYNKFVKIRDYKELEGLWEMTGFGCSWRPASWQKVRITVTASEIIATKVTGDDCLGPGTVHFRIALPGPDEEFTNVINSENWKWQVQDPPEYKDRKPYWINGPFRMYLYTDYIYNNSYQGVHYERIKESNQRNAEPQKTKSDQGSSAPEKAAKSNSIDMANLLNALLSTSSGMSVKEKNDFLVTMINRSGVGFELTPANERTLRNAGANDELINAIREGSQ
ncbi:MAG: hypothetical protein HKN33_18100 [Pyrinomonadaceae bacterium]|nr:hypothetical protein [Pyrinomonadaceae bacterium]